MQERFLLVNVLHQSGEVKLQGVALLFEHALHPQIADAQQQQHQCAEQQQSFVQTQRTAGQFVQKCIGMRHYSA